MEQLVSQSDLLSKEELKRSLLISPWNISITDSTEKCFEKYEEVQLGTLS